MEQTLATGVAADRLIDESRQLLSAQLGVLRAQHRSGVVGAVVAGAMSNLVDRVVRCHLNAAVGTLSGTKADRVRLDMALMALGGYGRAELAPYSDVDLLFLYRPGSRRLAERVARILVAELWDIRLELGSSMRTVSECVQLASEDITSHTALLEARLVEGSAGLGAQLVRCIRRLHRGSRRWEVIQEVVRARKVERLKFGTKVQLLEPDVKRSKGGLRDLHLIRWISWVCCGSSDWNRLLELGLLTAAEVSRLNDSREFLLRLRNELHFKAGRRQDNLTFEDQLRVSGFFGFTQRPGMLPVESFMQQYYRLGSSVGEILDRLIWRVQRESLWRRVKRTLLSHRLERHYLVAGNDIQVKARFEPALMKSPSEMLRLFELANRAGADIVPELREKIRVAAEPMESEDFSAARPIFLRLLGVTGNLGLTLERLHEVGILEKLIPEFSHARGLIQFNRYHKYTVDEHSLLCVETAQSFRKRDGVLGQAYHQIRHKELLHLALLIHDLGKGFQEDHCEVGRNIAAEVARRFELNPHQSEILVFLVHKHLLMGRLAYRRDVSDEGLLARFARQVGTPEVLRMLFVLTAADISSIGPESWTSWKEEILSDLFRRTMERLSGDVTCPDPGSEAARVREELGEKLSQRLPEGWLREHLQTMPNRYLLGTSPELIAHHLEVFRELPAGQVRTECRRDEQTGVTSLTVYTFDNITPGLFSKVTGVLTAKGLEILSANIMTFGDGLVVDRFEVLDHDYSGPPPTERQQDIRNTIQEVLLGKQAVESLMIRSARRFRPGFEEVPATLREPPSVRIDNESSSRHTILDVFATDSQGLLYAISHAIFELGLAVSLAKIATSMDQVLDVFYVTDSNGLKVEDRERLDVIRDRIEAAIRGLEKRGGF